MSTGWSPLPERSGRVSTLELFFDLVLVDGDGLEPIAQVVVMLLLIWWMYDGYAWLTNAIATEGARARLLLIGGMGGFLLIALAVPHAYDGDGLAFGIGYAVVVVLHSAMYMRRTSLSEAEAILRIAPFILLAVVLVLVGGALGGVPQDVIWACAGVLLWFTPAVTSVEGFVVTVSHFVERHGLVVIVALGESIVVIGAGASGLELDVGLALAALLSLGLSAALWWVYFSDEDDVERGLEEMAPAERAQRSVLGFGYWHYGILLGIVALAAGLKKTIGDPYDPLSEWIAIDLALGVALFMACEVGYRRTFGVRRNRIRLLAAAAAIASVPLGLEAGGAWQVGGLAALVAAALALESRAATAS